MDLTTVVVNVLASLIGAVLGLALGYRCTGYPSWVGRVFEWLAGLFRRSPEDRRAEIAHLRQKALDAKKGLRALEEMEWRADYLHLAGESYRPSGRPTYEESR